LHAILRPAGDHFSRFLLVVLAFSVIANVSPTLYSCSLSLQVFLPFDATLRIPRYLLSTGATAALIPLAILAASYFEVALANFLGLIGYWSAIFAAIVFVEHVVFRKARFELYDVSLWDTPSKLPPGIAALTSCAVGAALCVLCMEQVWFTGPVAKTTGDLGFELAFVAAGVAYIPFRYVESKVFLR
jgi:purine-cytosine permease-like protein